MKQIAIIITLDRYGQRIVGVSRRLIIGDGREKEVYLWEKLRTWGATKARLIHT